VQFFNEAVIQKQGDEPTKRMLILWHQECLSRVKHDIEVIMADRRQNPELRDFPGKINSAAPAVLFDKLYLVLWFDTVDPIKPLLITHELGHWILALRGYKLLVDPAGTYGSIVMNLNSLVQHPPLFALQRSIGHEPQEMIDQKAENDYQYLQKEEE
jgi:hypothetical protein